ncbi:hypothetical protein SAMN05443550_105169 [Pedobacter hartonius]|uniref:Uncharacterized protein n=1 Tax=Pedobacter hartonius TaxID=425514 RepID=A0A1H4DZU4_9SPHI|nr:hypothetical protein SAMN05443550_105169 [Pedobacter hartonius]
MVNNRFNTVDREAVKQMNLSLSCINNHAGIK